MPFNLEYYKPPVLERTKTTIYSKNSFKYPVKDSNWQNGFEAEPIDNNPYSKEKYSLHISHYKRLGNNEEKGISKEIKTTVEVPKKTLINYYSYSDQLLGAQDQSSFKHYLKMYEKTFLTTMQSSYTPPYPYAMQRLALPKTPYFLYRRLAENCNSKFLDDDYICHIIRLQKYKKSHHNSYDPISMKYTLFEKK